MKRDKQPYLVNPFNPLNPYEVFTVSPRRVVAEVDKKGKFKRVKTIKKGKKHKAKKISARLGKKLFKKAISKKRIKRIKRINRNPIALIGNPIRSKYMRRKSIKRKNPISFIKQREGKELVELAIDGAVIVVSSTASKLLMDKIAEKVSVLNKPIGKVAGHLGLGALIYLGGSKIKKIPSRYVRLATLGAMLPAIIDMVDFVKAKVSGVKEMGQDDEEMLAYVPETSAYVPETSAYVPETSELGEDYTTGY